MIQKLAVILFAPALFAAHAHAVILQLNLDFTTELSSYAEWTDPDTSITDSTSDIPSMTNSGSAIEASVNYSFGGEVLGHTSGSATVGDSDTFYISLIAFDVDNGGDGVLSSLFSTIGWTMEIVAEAGETNGTPVTLDWSTALGGLVSESAYTNWTITVGGTTLMTGSATATFDNAESGQITGYSIGDTFDVEVLIEAGTSAGPGMAAFAAGDVLTVQATAVPEPGALSLLGLGALAFLRRRQP